MKRMCHHRPIYGTDLTKQPDDLIEDVRSGLMHLRGQLADIRHAYGWDDRLEQHEGALTVAIMALSLTSKMFTDQRNKSGDIQYKEADREHA